MVVPLGLPAVGIGIVAGLCTFLTVLGTAVSSAFNPDRMFSAQAVLTGSAEIGGREHLQHDVSSQSAIEGSISLLSDVLERKQGRQVELTVDLSSLSMRETRYLSFMAGLKPLRKASTSCECRSLVMSATRGS